MKLSLAPSGSVHQRFKKQFSKTNLFSLIGAIPMYFELFLAAALMAFGAITFKRFEERTPPLRGVIKLIVILLLTAAITYFFGSAWGIAWVVGVYGLGLI